MRLGRGPLAAFMETGRLERTEAAAAEALARPAPIGADGMRLPLAHGSARTSVSRTASIFASTVCSLARR